MALNNVYTGANATLTLANEDTPEGQDAQRVIDAYQTQTVGRLTGVKVRVDTELEEFHEVGRRHATSLHPGNIHISGSVERAYINGALLLLLQGRGSGATSVAEPYVQPVFNMTVALSDPASPGSSVSLELKGVKFENWGYSLPEDEFVMENLCYKALTVRVIDREAPEGGGEGVAVAPSFSDEATA